MTAMLIFSVCVLGLFFLPRYDSFVLEALEHPTNVSLIGNVLHIPAIELAIIGDTTYDTVRVVTDTGNYWAMLLPSEDGRRLEVVSVYQTAPKEEWVLNELDVTPQVAMQLTKRQHEIGTIIQTLKANKIQTTKGTYVMHTKGGYITALSQDNEDVLKIPLEFPILPRTQVFLHKNRERIGEIFLPLNEEWDETKQSYTFSAENGIFRIDEYHDGSAELLEGSQKVK